MALVQKARAQGIKRQQMPEHLTWLTGTDWDQPRVNAAWKGLRKNKGKLDPSALADPQWKARSNKGTIYQRRLRERPEWEGRWIYAHSLKGKALESDHKVMFAERYKGMPFAEGYQLIQAA